MSTWPDERISFFARTVFRNQRKVFGIKQSDRRSHMYVLGKTGTGKTTLLENLARQDIGTGQSVILIDPHGDMVERLVAWVPERRRADLIYFNAPDPAVPIAFNPLDAIPPSRRSLAGSFVLDVFKKLWPDFWGPRLEHILRYALLALMDQPEATIADVPRLFADKLYRRQVAGKSINQAVQRFWQEEYENYPYRMRAEAVSPILNKVGAYLAHPILQQIVTRPKSSFDLRQVMDEGKILLVNLGRGRLGDDAASLLGSLLVSAIQVAAMSRADVLEEERKDCFVFLDEFQNFTTEALAGMLAELRKYHVNMCFAHQHLAQLDPDLRAAVLGNVGTIVSFRLGSLDAGLLRREFAPELDPEDLVNLPNHRIYVRLMINGVVSRPFSAETLLLH